MTYAGGTIYDVATLCQPVNVNQGYACDGRNFGDKNLDQGTVTNFCQRSGIAFGHGLGPSQTCGSCAEVRVRRADGGYNTLTVMMVDTTTRSAEIGQAEMHVLLDNNAEGKVLNDRLTFDYRIVPCFGGDSPGPAPTPSPSSSAAPCTSSCGACKARVGAHQAVTDGQCAPCANGQSWWPCDVSPYLCVCDDGPAATPSPQPTIAPTPPSPTPPTPPSSSGKELVAFVENWKACPSLQQIKGYTKVAVSFAVTYTWAPSKNVCDQSCRISTPVPVCSNSPQAGLVQSWQAEGTKVLLSFGGAGMGGSWDGLNDCWEYCFGKADSVADQLKAIVDDQGFDGVDIDYEYFHTEASGKFLADLTSALRQKLGQGKIISHAPMDGDISMGKPYFNVLKSVASQLDYVMPQYYNGPFRPANNLSPALAHMGDLVDNMFDGDQSKVLFGFCIADCSGTGSNVNSAQAASIMQQVSVRFPNNGGAFLWAASDDQNWSPAVATALGLA